MKNTYKLETLFCNGTKRHQEQSGWAWKFHWGWVLKLILEWMFTHSWLLIPSSVLQQPPTDTHPFHTKILHEQENPSEAVHFFLTWYSCESPPVLKCSSTNEHRAHRRSSPWAATLSDRTGKHDPAARHPVITKNKIKYRNILWPHLKLSHKASCCEL